MPPIVVKDISRVFSSWVELYKKYKETRFVIGKEDFVNNTITKNQLKLPRRAPAHRLENPVISISLATIMKMGAARSHRKNLATENSLFRCTKIFCQKPKAGFWNAQESQYMLINNQMNSQMSSQLNSMIAVLYIVDLSVEMRARAIAVSGQVCTYIKFVLLILNSIAPNVREYNVKQFDLVVDFYREFSIKSGISAGVNGKQPQELCLTQTIIFHAIFQSC